MLYRKSGFPEVHDIVLCTVTRIQFTSVFVQLDEYDLPGMLHVSEVSPGRIRNLSDFVKEGKKIVCKVIRINRERGHIDLSLRRVNEGQRREKLNQVKAEMKAEKIVELAANSMKVDVKKLYDQVTEKVFEQYEFLYEFFNKVALEGLDIKTAKLPEDISKKLEEIIKQKITPLVAEAKVKLNVSSFAPDGVDIIRHGLKLIKEANKDVLISYLGSGTYHIRITSSDPKKAEKAIESCVKKGVDFLESKGAEVTVTQG